MTPIISCNASSCSFLPSFPTLVSLAVFVLFADLLSLLTLQNCKPNTWIQYNLRIFLPSGESCIFSSFSSFVFDELPNFHSCFEQIHESKFILNFIPISLNCQNEHELSKISAWPRNRLVVSFGFPAPWMPGLCLTDAHCSLCYQLIALPIGMSSCL